MILSNVADTALRLIKARQVRFNSLRKRKKIDPNISKSRGTGTWNFSFRKPKSQAPTCAVNDSSSGEAIGEIEPNISSTVIHIEPPPDENESNLNVIPATFLPLVEEEEEEEKEEAQEDKVHKEKEGGENEQLGQGPCNTHSVCEPVISKKVEVCKSLDDQSASRTDAINTLITSRQDVSVNSDLQSQSCTDSSKFGN
jgi:hypothetical protein